MKIEDAYEILGLKPDATEAERHDTFRRLQTKLEDKLGRAPTPGLKAKYRASLLKLEQAIEVIELSTDGADLPMLRPDYNETGETPTQVEHTSSSNNNAPEKNHGSAASTHSEPRTSKNQPVKQDKLSQGGSNRKEVMISVLVVFALIVAGAGWWFGYESPRRLEVADIVEKADKLEEKGELNKALKLLEKALFIKSSSKQAKESHERVNQELERIASQELRAKEQEASKIARDVERLLVAARMDQTQEKWVESLAGYQKVMSLNSDNAEAKEAVARLEKLLEHARGSVVVKTEPGGATVRLGGRGEDVTPANYEDLKLGGYTVQIEKKGYDPLEKEVLVRKDQTTVLGPLRMTRSEGALLIKSKPEGMSYSVQRVRSDVSSDRDFEIRQGSTPAVEADLPTGIYQVIMKRSGWPDYRRNVEVPRDRKKEVSTLFAQGSLLIESEPSGVEVYASTGTRLGTTPYRANAATGTHTFKLSQPGHQKESLTLTVHADKEAKGKVAHWTKVEARDTSSAGWDSYLKSQIGSSASSIKSKVYLGKYDGSTIITALQWLPNSRISGAVFIPSAGRELRIYGENYQEGRLKVELWEGGKQTASGRLSKNRSGSNKIVWGGSLSNGNYLEFGRVLARSSSSFRSSYSGKVGSSSISASLNWNSDRTVSGHYRSRSTGNSYQLYGDNSVEGFLYLDEMTNGVLSARILLAKKRSNGSIVWSGTLFNVKGPRRSFSMRKM